MGHPYHIGDMSETRGVPLRLICLIHIKHIKPYTMGPLVKRKKFVKDS